MVKLSIKSILLKNSQIREFLYQNTENIRSNFIDEHFFQKADKIRLQIIQIKTCHN